jgi:hypothetical protein
MSPKPYDPLQVTRLASLVKVARPTFSAIFDAFSKQQGGSEFKFIHIMAGSPPADAPEFLRAFEYAAKHGWLEQLVHVLLTADALYEDEDKVPVKPAYVELQKITQPHAGMPDAARDSAAAERARQRVCRITVLDEDERATYGTGFLVGPQTVLTSFHVVSSLIDQKDEPNSWKRLKVTFDLFGQDDMTTVDVAEKWLVCHSAPHDAEQSLDTDIFAEEIAPEDFRERLDFAVIRLRQAEGRARGYYSVEDSHEPTVESPVIVFQHPGGTRLVRCGGTASKLWPDGVRTRLRHDANTVKGSSGGLVLGKEFELVALHQAGLKLPGSRVINAAIPACCIAKKRHEEGKRFDDVIGVDPMWCIAATGMPVFGRIAFQEMLLRAVSGMKRVLIVRGPPKSGVSFSADILKDRLGLTEHLIVEVSAKEVPSDAGALARLLLSRAGADEKSVAGLPMFDTADTAMDAWLHDILLPDFLKRLLRHCGEKTVWLIFDDLHKVDLPTTSTVSFIRMLLQCVVVQSKLRIVLLGHCSLAAFAPTEYTESDDVSPVTERDITRTIKIRDRQKGLPLKPTAVVEEKAKDLYQWATMEPGPFLPRLVAAYRRIVEQQTNGLNDGKDNVRPSP